MAFAFLLWPLSRMLSRPLGELRASALRIADGDLEHRVRPRGSDEIGELGRSFNVMADGVQRMVTGTRELTAHVSHELRSPLARIRVATELLKDQESSRTPGELYAEIEDLDRLIGRILQLSRLDLQSPVAELREELFALAERYRPIFERGGVPLCDPGRARPRSRPPVSARLSPGSVQLSPEDLQAAMSVLFDNVAKYAHRRLRVEFTAEDESLWIRSRNDRAAAPRRGLNCF